MPPPARSPDEQARIRSTVEARREAKRAARTARKAFEASDPATIQARLQSRKLRDDVIDRVNTIRKQVLGANRKFAGELLISKSDIARISDRDMLAAMGPGALGGVNAGGTLVYWTDATALNYKSNVEGSANSLGVAVVWMERDPTSAVPKYRSKEFMLGRNTGGIGDAELYAVSAAVGLAIEEVARGEGKIHRVRVLTD